MTRIKIVLLFVLGGAGFAAWQMSAVSTLPDWAVIALQTVALLAVLGLVLCATMFAWQKFYESKGPRKDEEPEIEDETAPRITAAVKNLDRVLADIERDTSRATVRIADANAYTETLVQLVKGIALKGEAMRQESMAIGNALEAIESGNPVGIAKAAGGLSDQHLRNLMLCDVWTESYWAGVSRTLAAQQGTLVKWAASYDKFVGNLLTDLSSAKAMAAQLTASKELAIVARPMLQIQAGLAEAQHVLSLQRRVTVGEAVGQLPTVNSGLLAG